MRSDFCAMVLTHGRPERQLTLNALKRYNYTGRTFVVIDDEDKTGDEYRRRYGDMVRTFSKTEIARRYDEADNFTDRRTIFYARNAAFDIARREGFRYFVQLDDDYHWMGYKYDARGRYGSWPFRNLDAIFERMVDVLQVPQISTVAFCQGGDLIGGPNASQVPKRKAMNSFFCDTEKQFPFLGRVNEDVSTYVSLGRRGFLFFTVMDAQLVQDNTQGTAGGMTGLYLDHGTYVKSFYSVMRELSCVRIARMGSVKPRLHHAIAWNAAAPKILRQEHRKPCVTTSAS